LSARRPYGAGSLYTRTNANGSETYHGRWYVEVGSRRKQVRARVGPKRPPGTRDGLTQRQAEDKLRALIAERQSEPVRPDDKTLGWAADRMFATLERKNEPGTIDGYRRDFNNHVRPRLGDKTLTAIVPEDVDGLVAALLDPNRKPRPLKPKTVRNIALQVGQIFNYGKRQRPAWVTSNPVETVDLPKIDRAADDVLHLTQPEVARLLAAINTVDEFAAVDHALYLTAAMCGLRQGELLALRWDHIDWQAQRINVRINHARKHGDRSPKSKASRRSVPLPDAVGGVLDRLSKSSAFNGSDDRVFGHPVSGDVLDYSALDRRLAATVKAAKVRPITFHGLRHTFAVQCARSGVPMVTLQHWMGHADTSATEIYARFAKDQNEVAMIETAFDSLSHSLTQSEPISPALDSAQTAQ
jgi:integrase